MCSPTLGLPGRVLTCNCTSHYQSKIPNHISFGNFLTVHANMFPLNIVKPTVHVKACIKVIAKILKQGSWFVARTQTSLRRSLMLLLMPVRYFEITFQHPSFLIK